MLNQERIEPPGDLQWYSAARCQLPASLKHSSEIKTGSHEYCPDMLLAHDLLEAQHCMLSVGIRQHGLEGTGRA